MREERPLLNLPRLIEYEGPLREVFLRGSDLFSGVEIISNGTEFTTTIDWFSDALVPRSEFLRVLFINPETVRRVVLSVKPDEMKLERIVGFGEKEESELVFSKKVQSLIDSIVRPDWSIEDLEIISEQSLVDILNQLDPKVALDEEGKIKPTLKPAKEIVELIGKNLGVLA